jgi:hypothetical protein
MNKYMKAALVILAGLVLAFFAFTALRPAITKSVTSVQYYPKANVYYSADAGEYYFYHAEQKAWISTKKLNSSQVASLGDHIDIPYTEPVWRNNSHDRMVHSVNLYAAPSLVKTQYREDSLSLIPKKKPVTSASKKPAEPPVEEEKPKKGLKKFLDKIFKGKKQPEQDI